MKLLNGGWADYQKKYASRSSAMLAEERTVPEREGDDIFEVKSPMIIGPTTGDKASQYSCKLSSELEYLGGAVLPFATLYDKRSAEYNTFKLSFKKKSNWSS